MKRFLSTFLFFIIVFTLLFFSYDVIESIKLSFSICINNLFPSLIPFMLLSNILIKYNFIDDMSYIFGNFMNKILKVNKNCAFILIMSMISGTPSNGKYISDLLNNNLIDLDDANKCLKFCHFTNPIFILGTIGYTFLGNKKLGLIILISHFLSSFIICIFNKKKTYKETITTNKINKKNNFIYILNESIKSTISTLLLILGIITTCLIITCLLNKIFNINNNYKFIYGIIEITQGLKFLSLSNLSIKLKTIISSFLISFGGFCIHMQVFSILDNKKIRYIPYLICRVFHGIISSLITLVIINLLH